MKSGKSGLRHPNFRLEAPPTEQINDQTPLQLDYVAGCNALCPNGTGDRFLSGKFNLSDSAGCPFDTNGPGRPICTLASILGALLGYAIGMFLYEAVGQPILALYGKEDSFEKVSEWYNTYGGWGVLFAAVTPFPYKVLTIFSGATGLNLATFVLVSIVGRSVRFFAVGFLLYKFGEPIRLFIEKYLGILFAIFMVLLLGGFYALRYMF